jgi:hypothetical protein
MSIEKQSERGAEGFLTVKAHTMRAAQHCVMASGWYEAV